MKKLVALGLFMALSFSGVAVSYGAETAAPAEKHAAGLVGAWKPFGPLTEADKDVFKTAQEHLLGVHYEALEVRTQLVSGMNYEFFCNAQVVAPGTTVYPAVIRVYKPLKGEPVIKVINLKAVLK